MRQPWFALGVMVCALAAGNGSAWAQRPRPAGDEQIVRQAELAASGERVEIYQHGVRVAPAFLKLAEEAYSRLEALTGRKLDTATLGPMKLFESEHPEADLPRLYGASREELARLAVTGDR
jgi:sirohydrochlorin ferrochelatase